MTPSRTPGFGSFDSCRDDLFRTIVTAEGGAVHRGVSDALSSTGGVSDSRHLSMYRAAVFDDIKRAS